MNRAPWFPAVGWRDTARAAAVDAVNAIAAQRYPPLPPEPLVEVIAVTSSWCIDGRAVAPGARYRLPRTEADVLEFSGKARRV